jgi:glyoxylase-like metal-dependent hydrolase (beta-lactamase superfamily II)
MKISKIKNRSTLYTFDNGTWDLNLHLIQANKYNYVIDSGLGTQSVEPIIETLKKDNKQIILINTHYHWDHIWGNDTFSDCIIISHQLCRERIAEKWEEMINKNASFIQGEAKCCLPSLTFKDELYFPEDKIRLIYTPGHTQDSISVIDEEEGVINVGDNIGDNMEELIPSLELESNQYINTLLKYQTLDFDTCVSGHNTVLNKDVINTILGILSK